MHFLQKIASFWVMVILTMLKLICGITWKIKGLNNIKEQPCILVSNHHGLWESLFIQTLVYPSYNILKKELLYIPIFGWALACLKPISIKRSNKFSSLKRVINEGSNRIKEGGSLVIFPEGTRAKPEKGLKAFSNSCGLLSVKNSVPIIPICHNSGFYWENRKFIKKKGLVEVRIGEPISGDDPKALTSEVYNWINKNFTEIN
tara:strand:+ start:711 stop:1319 length:609 start_codon:yes stop_codon:yes gene_type:complete